MKFHKYGDGKQNAPEVTWSKMYVCQVCKKVYKHKGNLKRHLDYECGKEASFLCEFCEFKCKRLDYLRVHVKTKHYKEVTQCLRKSDVPYEIE
ncbi:hypothetical protein WA026_023224 [Henosepilachna vigintioctopunctata]|uniref:C2H2-type domain-containing protein n=1 Tax=Henosepilachna vigintioctopunctata TaxID=420089 RepID=A0AAW1VIY4_9CUCU